MNHPKLVCHLKPAEFHLHPEIIRKILGEPTTIQRTKEAKMGSTDSPSVEINESKSSEYTLAQMYMEESRASLSCSIRELDLTKEQLPNLSDSD